MNRAGCTLILVAEAVGSVVMWALIPLAWMWIGSQVYKATGSLAADGFVAFCGFAGSTWLAMVGLHRLDRRWIAMRVRDGHAQREGALSRVVIVSATLGLLAFLAWFYFLGGLREGHFVIPFMPTN